MKKKLLGTICFVFLACGAFSETISLTLDQAVEYALKNNRTLKSNDIDLAIKERAAKYSWNVLLPTVQVTGTMSRSQESNYSTIKNSVGQGASFAMGSFIPMSMYDKLAEDAGFEDNENAHWTAVGGISASLNLSLAMIYSIRATKADYEAGKITWEQSQTETVANIKKLFYGLLLAQESLKIDKASLENKRQRMVQAETNYKNGAIPELSLLQTQVDYQNTKPTVETSERTLRQQMTHSLFFGMPVGESDIVLEGSIEPTYLNVTSNQLIDDFGTNSLNLKSLDENLNILDLNLKALNLSAWTPALALSWNTQPSMIYAWDFSRWSEEDNWNKSGALSITLAFNLTNLLPWSSNRQQAKDLEANIEKLKLSREMVLENQKVEVRKAVDTLNQAKEQIEAMGRNVTLAQKAYDVTYRSYRNGMTELLDLRDAETSLNQAKLGLLNQKFQYISAMLDLEKTLNTTLSK